MSVKKNYEKRTNICVTRPANGAKITFETYNLIMAVLLHRVFVSLKHIQKEGKNVDSGTRTNVVCFRTVLLSRVNCFGYACYLQQNPLSLQTSLAAELARRMLGKINEVKFMF